MAQVHQSAQGFTDADWDDILARVAADEDLVQQLQAGEKYSEENYQESLWNLVQSFVPMDSELEDKRLKRVGQEGLEKPAKRQKIREASRINVEALQTKYPIIDWKVWKIIRVGNYTEVYQVFEDMLKNFDRDDLVKLWSQVHERFNLTELTDDKAK
ncbi:hypothetical protein Tco_0967485 [Tanacetum coccineum]